MSNTLVLLALILWSMMLSSEFTILYHGIREFTLIDVVITCILSVNLVVETMNILFRMEKSK